MPKYELQPIVEEVEYFKKGGLIKKKLKPKRRRPVKKDEKIKQIVNIKLGGEDKKQSQPIYMPSPSVVMQPQQQRSPLEAFIISQLLKGEKPPGEPAQMPQERQPAVAIPLIPPLEENEDNEEKGKPIQVEFQPDEVPASKENPLTDYAINKLYNLLFPNSKPPASMNRETEIRKFFPNLIDYIREQGLKPKNYISLNPSDFEFKPEPKKGKKGGKK